MARILVIATGGVRAPSTLELIEIFLAEGHEVRLLATRNALRFLFVPVLASLRRLRLFMRTFRPQLRETLAYFAYRHTGVPHIDEGRWCDLAIVVPATSNSIGKLVAGLADNYPILVVRGIPRTKCVLVVPSMNPEMWLDPFLQHNIDLLNASEKYRVLCPSAGEMASGDFGIGAQAPTNVILDEIDAALGGLDQTSGMPLPVRHRASSQGAQLSEAPKAFVVVEEDAALRGTICEALKRAAPEGSVEAFCTASDALPWFRDNEAAALLTALEFSAGASGQDLVEAIRRIHSVERCQIVATSTRSRAEARAEALARDDVYFLPKPINIAYCVGMLIGLTGARSAPQRTTRQHLQSGEILFREGDPGSEIYFVVSGLLEVSIGQGNSRRILQRVGDGEILGEMAFLTAERRSATVAAVEDCKLVRVELDQYRDYLDRQPIWLRHMIESLATRLRHANARSGGAA